MDPKAASSAIAKFSTKFCNELVKNKSVVCSPLSTEFILALLTLGVPNDNGEHTTLLFFTNSSVVTEPAHSELLTSLGLSDDDSIRALFSTTSSKLKSLQGVTLNVANKVYVQDGDYDLQPQLKLDAVEIFDAEVEKVDFGNGATISKINEWVEYKTNYKIKNLMTPGSVDILTRLLLVNAIYFKGTWKDQFNPEHTNEHPFYVNATTTINIPMMFKQFDYPYGSSEVLKAQLLEMPYIGDEASMLVVLPQENEGLSHVMDKLAAGHDLLADVEQMHKTKVRVTMPKFKIETTIDLKALLPKLGISAIFNSGNSGITKLLNTEDHFFVSSAVQKVFIEVNEEGAEAAAVTRMAIMKKLRPSYPEFRADHPYLYMLLGAEKVPLFIGVYCGNQ